MATTQAVPAEKAGPPVETAERPRAPTEAAGARPDSGGPTPSGRIAQPQSSDAVPASLDWLHAYMRAPMNPVNKALWYVESHFAEELSLDDVAKIACVSRYHMTRAFGMATGRSLIRYLRGRRLTEAARALANGAPEILDVALSAGYGSHEAFTRAFREQFGITPEEARTRRNLDNLELVEPIKMDEALHLELVPPRFVDREAFLVAGSNKRYSCEQSAAIPAQWQAFTPHLDKVPGQVGRAAYGIMYNHDDDGDFDYLCGVEVASFSSLPGSFDRLRVPAQRYAVFEHPGHVSEIRSAWSAVWNKWFPGSGRELADAPYFERYGEEFDGRTGRGGFELWVPIR
jgi:AraC family transcriptional regulator